MSLDLTHKAGPLNQVCILPLIPLSKGSTDPKHDSGDASAKAKGSVIPIQNEDSMADTLPHKIFVGSGKDPQPEGT